MNCSLHSRRSSSAGSANSQTPTACADSTLTRRRINCHSNTTHRACAKKKWGPPLGTGSPGRRVPLLASFSHQRVGSSILASLSEAGGDDRQKLTSKPLPPRLSLSTSRQMGRVHAVSCCTACANVFPGSDPLSCLLSLL